MSAELARHPDLEIRSSQVGRVIAEREVEVTFRQSAAYAAAIGAARDCYLDDRHPGGPVAPPCLITALEWPLVSGAEHLEALGVPEAELFPRLLHAFQDTRFARPIRVGDVLRIEATLASVRATRSGALTVLRLVSRERGGGLVAESWFGSFFRGASAPRSVAALAAPAIEPAAHAATPTVDPVTLTRGHAHVYGECAGLWNPIHTEPGFAAAAGFPDVALHGTLVWAIAGERVIDRSLGFDPGRLARLAARFLCPIFPGRALDLRQSPSTSRPGDILVDVVQNDGDPVLLAGIAETRKRD